jgi:CheY-like chemotaxis protein
MHILIVDDNQRMRILLKAVLRDTGAAMSEASDGAEAVECYRAQRPDAVFMDIRMPVMDGIEATRKIVHLDPNACVVIVTDFDMPEYRRDATKAGAKAYVVKDKVYQLRDVLMDVLK